MLEEAWAYISGSFEGKTELTPSDTRLSIDVLMELTATYLDLGKLNKARETLGSSLDRIRGADGKVPAVLLGKLATVHDRSDLHPHAHQCMEGLRGWERTARILE